MDNIIYSTQNETLTFTLLEDKAGQELICLAKDVSKGIHAILSMQICEPNKVWKKDNAVFFSDIPAIVCSNLRFFLSVASPLNNSSRKLRANLVSKFKLEVLQELFIYCTEQFIYEIAIEAPIEHFTDLNPYKSFCLRKKSSRFLNEDTLLISVKAGPSNSPPYIKLQNKIDKLVSQIKQNHAQELEKLSLSLKNGDSNG